MPLEFARNLAVGEAPHGTRARWSNGCDCPQCRQAQNDTVRSYGRARAQYRLPVEVREQVRERSRPPGDRSSLRVSPIPRRPRGLAARSGASLGLMLTLRYGVTLRAEAFTHTRREVIQRSRSSFVNYSWISSSLSSLFGSVICPPAVTYASVPPVIATVIGGSKGLKSRSR
jgi:hypothetical protein